MTMSRVVAAAYRRALTYRSQSSDTAWAGVVAAMHKAANRTERVEIERAIAHENKTHLFTRRPDGALAVHPNPPKAPHVPK